MTAFYDLSLERATLGAMMLNQNAVMHALTNLGEGAFTTSETKYVFRGILSLFRKNAAIDVISLAQELRSFGLGETETVPLSTVVGWIESCPNPHAYKTYISALKEHEVKRVLYNSILNAKDTLENTGDKDEAMAFIQKSINEVIYNSSEDKVFKLSDVIDENILEVRDVIDRTAKGEVVERGIHYGYAVLDSCTRGMKKNELIIIGARPGTGKTAFALNLAINVANQGNKVLFFSLEMDKRDLMLRAFSAVKEKSSFHMLDYSVGEQDVKDLQDFRQWSEEKELFIYESAYLNTTTLYAMAKSQKPDVIIIDYLQLMSSSGGKQSTYDRVSEIARTLKQIASELHIRVIALSQLSRSSEKGADNRPKNSDLRESGEIEQAADSIMLLHRPYLFDKDSHDERDIEIILSKNRHGPTGVVKASFIAEYSIIQDNPVAF